MFGTAWSFGSIAPSPENLEWMENEFKDILLKGAHFVNQGALPEESDFWNFPAGLPLSTGSTSAGSASSSTP
jgi:hypothetical protein